MTYSGSNSSFSSAASIAAVTFRSCLAHPAADLLRRLAFELERSESGLIRQAVREFLERQREGEA